MLQRFKGSQLDRRIQLQRPVVARDPVFGAVATTWQTFATVWAQRLELEGVVKTETDQRVGSHQVRHLIRYRGDVDATCRVVDGARRFRLTSPPFEVGRRSGLMLVSEETTDA